MGIPFSSPCWGIKITSKFFFCENFFSWPKKWPKFIFLAIFWPFKVQKNYLPLKKSQRPDASFDTPPRSLSQKLDSLHLVLCRARFGVHGRTFSIFAHFFFLTIELRSVPSFLAPNHLSSSIPSTLKKNCAKFRKMGLICLFFHFLIRY